MGVKGKGCFVQISTIFPENPLQKVALITIFAITVRAALARLCLAFFKVFS